MKSYFLNRKNILFLIVVIIAVFFNLFYYYAIASPDVPIPNPGSDFQVCTSNVSQPACYNGSHPTPTFNWTFTGDSSQVSYWVEADNNGDHNGTYPSLEINTGEKNSNSTYYTAIDDASNGLLFNTTYYWKVAVKDDYNTWSGWTCADVTFTTNGPCNVAPTASNLSTTIGNYCSSPSQYFSWTYSDPDSDNESRFQIQVDNNSNFSSPEVNRDYSGLSNSSPTTNNQTVVVSVSLIADKFVYNTTYYWRVKVYDPNGADSGWVNGSNFTTEKHQYPLIDFNWSPSNPSQGEDALFADQSTVYGGASKSAWSWIFTDGNPAGSSQQNPTIQFNSTEDEQATLQVTDSDGYSCSVSKTVNIQLELPGWEEK